MILINWVDQRNQVKVGLLLYYDNLRENPKDLFVKTEYEY